MLDLTAYRCTFQWTLLWCTCEISFIRAESKHRSCTTREYTIATE
jgi:hypothetical protein